MSTDGIKSEKANPLPILRVLSLKNCVLQKFVECGNRAVRHVIIVRFSPRKLRFTPTAVRGKAEVVPPHTIMGNGDMAPVMFILSKR